MTRRTALVLFVNSAAAVVGAGLSAVLGAFALRPPRPAQADRWVRAGGVSDLTPNVPVPRVVSLSRQDGWYRERARETVFLVWDGGKSVQRDVGNLHAPGMPGAVGRRRDEIPLPLPRRLLRCPGERRRWSPAAPAGPHRCAHGRRGAVLVQL